MAEPFVSYFSDITVDWHRLKYSNYIELGSRSLLMLDPMRTVSVLSPLTGIATYCLNQVGINIDSCPSFLLAAKFHNFCLLCLPLQWLPARNLILGPSLSIRKWTNMKRVSIKHIGNHIGNHWHWATVSEGRDW